MAYKSGITSVFLRVLQLPYSSSQFCLKSNMHLTLTRCLRILLQCRTFETHIRYRALNLLLHCQYPAACEKGDLRYLTYLVWSPSDLTGMSTGGHWVVKREYPSVVLLAEAPVVDPRKLLVAFAGSKFPWMFLQWEGVSLGQINSVRQRCIQNNCCQSL